MSLIHALGSYLQLILHPKNILSTPIGGWFGFSEIGYEFLGGDDSAEAEMGWSAEDVCAGWGGVEL